MFLVEQNDGSVAPEYLFGQIVARYRTGYGLSQKAFADLLTQNGMPVDASAVSRLESGKRAVPLAELYVIADTLKLAPKHLLPPRPNPKLELSFARSAADRAWQSMGINASSLLGHIDEVVERLKKNPELINDLVSRDGQRLVNPEDYLEWVAHQVDDALGRKMLSNEFNPDDRAFVASQEAKDRALDSLRRLLAPFIVVGVRPEPPELPERDFSGEHPEEA